MEKINVLQKTFYKIIQDIGLSANKVRELIVDKRLSNVEKKIIETWLLVRNNQNKEAILGLSALPYSEMPFVEAQKNFVLGVALNNLSEFKNAQEHIQLAIPEFERLESVHFLFTSYFNLCHIFMNTKQFVHMDEVVRKMKDLPIESELQQLRLLRCQFNLASETNDFQQAKMLLAQIDPHKDEMCESDKISQLVSEFIFFVKIDDFDACRDSLEKMKSNRKFHLSENYNYMKKLLDHLTQDAPVYVYKEDFESTPVLDYQIRVISALEEKNNQLANDYWKKLQEIHPDLYSEDFVFNGGKCLFSLCLQKHRRSSIQVNFIEDDGNVSHLRKLTELFKNSTGPLTKGFLYEQLWNQPPIEKEDLKRLSRLISRLRTEKGMNISSRKGTYFYASPLKKKSVA